jgi:hypothetical protein
MTQARFRLVVFILAAAILCIGSRHLSFAADAKPAITVRAKLDKRLVSIGEKFKYSIIVSYPDVFEVELPVFGASLGNFSVRGSGLRSGGFFGRKKNTLWLELETFQTGKSVIPKTVIKYRRKPEKDWKEIEVSEETVEVKSLLEKSGVGQNAQIKDIKGPLSPGIRWKTVVFIIAIVLAAGAAIVSALLFKKKARGQAIRQRPAHEIALEQLERLKMQNLIQSGKVKEYYIQISGIIRHYLENRFNLRATEMTTEEFLIHVRDYSQLADGHKTLLKDFLLACDLVKFAKYLPAEQEIDAVFDSAKNFIEQTK